MLKVQRTCPSSRRVVWPNDRAVHPRRARGMSLFFPPNGGNSELARASESRNVRFCTDCHTAA